MTETATTAAGIPELTERVCRDRRTAYAVADMCFLMADTALRAGEILLDQCRGTQARRWLCRAQRMATASAAGARKITSAAGATPMDDVTGQLHARLADALHERATSLLAEEEQGAS